MNCYHMLQKTPGADLGFFVRGLLPVQSYVVVSEKDTRQAECPIVHATIT